MVADNVERPKIDPDKIWDQVQEIIDEARAERVAIVIETKNGGRITFEIDEKLRRSQDEPYYS